MRAARGKNLTMRLDFAYVTDAGGQENKGHKKAQYSLVYVY